MFSTSIHRARVHVNKCSGKAMSEGVRSPVTRFKYGYVLQGEKMVRGDIWVREGKIIDPHALFYEEKRLPDRVVDCEGLVVSPGFIDIQINGE